MIPYDKVRPFLPYLFWLWLISILILMVIPTGGGVHLNFPGRDKVIHFGLFSILGFFYIAPRYKNKTPFRISKENRNTFILLLFVISVEFVQLRLPYRSFELLDILANVLGILSGIIIGRRFLLRIFED
ncbi:MAG: VanZ family protein [Bacteroidales bacterium]|nr:VanZ family protein [Bacteroidales bacterium]